MSYPTEHTSKLMATQKVGEALMGIDVLVMTTEAEYGEYAFYQYNIRGQVGALIALPFFTYNEKHEQNFEGYLIYHDKDGWGYSEKELYSFGVEAIANNSLSGMAGKLSPLPYKPISEDDIEDALDSLIEKNTRVNLSDNLNL